MCHSCVNSVFPFYSIDNKEFSDLFKNYNENNVPPAQLQKTPLNRKGILAAVPIC